jgi:hypothetical protein
MFRDVLRTGLRLWKIELEREQMFINSRSLNCVPSDLLLSSGGRGVICGLILLLSGGSRSVEKVSINKEGGTGFLGI